MWSLAWEESIKNNLWFGNGYGKWLSDFSKLPGSENIGYDTAHNFWIQSIFELGLIHTSVILMTLFPIIWVTILYLSLIHI